jgi:hypothetical protein
MARPISRPTRSDPATVTRYVEERRDAFGVRADLSCDRRAAEHARRAQIPEAVPRALEDRRLVTEIHAAREGYRRVDGVRKTWKQLHRRGVEVGRDRVARLMRAEGLEGVWGA